MFSHGTLLFDSEMENVVSALNVKMDKIKSKGIKSIRSRVTNISEHLPEKLTMQDFKATLLKYLFEEFDEIPQYKLTEEDWQNIKQISEERYRNWDWNYGKSPKFNVQHSHRFDVGQIDVRLDADKHVIRQCKIYGDFFGIGDISEIEDRLVGIPYEREAIGQAIVDVDIKHYFGKITNEDFIDLLA
jgi:lipoate-protein ligase A